MSDKYVLVPLGEETEPGEIWRQRFERARRAAPEIGVVILQKFVDGRSLRVERSSPMDELDKEALWQAARSAMERMENDERSDAS